MDLDTEYTDDLEEMRSNLFNGREDTATVEDWENAYRGLIDEISKLNIKNPQKVHDILEDWNWHRTNWCLYLSGQLGQEGVQYAVDWLRKYAYDDKSYIALKNIANSDFGGSRVGDSHKVANSKISKCKVKDSIEGDYEFCSGADQSEEDARRYGVIQEWFDSFSQQEMSDYEDLEDYVDDMRGNIEIALFYIKGDEDKQRVQQIVSSYNRFKNTPIEDLELVIASSGKGWGKFDSNDDFMRIMLGERTNYSTIINKILISPSDALEILDMFTFKGGMFRYNENIDLFAQDGDVRRNVNDSKKGYDNSLKVSDADLNNYGWEDNGGYYGEDFETADEDWDEVIGLMNGYLDLVEKYNIDFNDRKTPVKRYKEFYYAVMDMAEKFSFSNPEYIDNELTEANYHTLNRCITIAGLLGEEEQQRLVNSWVRDLKNIREYMQLARQRAFTEIMQEMDLI